jgi:hypothetical protein
MIMGAIAFLSSIGASGSGVSHVAHLGGMVFGWLYLRGMRAPGRLGRVGLYDSLRRQYRDWQRARAKRKFEVYMRRHDADGSDRDRWVN